MSNCQRLRADVVVYDYPNAVAGPISWAQRLPVLLRNHGIDVRVLLLHWGDVSGGVLHPALTSLGVPVCAFRVSDTHANIRFLLKAIHDDPPDVFIANHVTPALLISGYVRSQGIPAIAVLRSDDAFYHGVIDVVVGGRVRDRVSAVVGVSEFLTRMAKVRNPSMDCIRIPSGTPIPLRCAEAGGRLRLVYSGRLVEEQKRISETIEAFIRACTEFPSLEVVILGDGPERARLEERVAECSVDIRFLGRLPVAEMLDELMRSHVIVLLSDYEGLPGAVVEGMACGLVPICLRMRSGSDELISHGLNGFIAEDRGAHFVECIRELHGSWERWSAMSRLARHSIVERFSLDVVSRQWATLIRRLAGQLTPKRGFTIPVTLDLPPVHPALAAEDIRPEQAATLRRVGHRLRRVLGKIRALLLRVYGSG